MQQYQVIVIGTGPAGYVCAIRCAQLGMKVACVEKYITANGKPAVGGTCLNVGCIPSKALLDSSHHLQFLREHAKEHGLNVSNITVDIPAMQKRKDKVVQTLTSGVASLLKKNKITVFSGTASFISARQIHVKNPTVDGVTEKLQGKHIIIASGSKPIQIQGVQIDNQLVSDSTGALNFRTAPKRLGIIGAGVIGLEMGSVWNRLGSKVIILEAMQTFLNLADETIAKEGFKALSKQGLDVRLGRSVNAIGVSDGKVLVKYSGNESLAVDKLIVAVGRKANTEGLKLESINVKTDARGFIEVDSGWQTSVKNVYAIGDVIGGAMLAHKGSEEGMALAERLAGQAGQVNYHAVPWVIYTWPEIAWVGKTEKQCKDANVAYRTGVFPFMALGRARAMGDTQGLIKIIGDKNTDRILGVHIIGANASELISEAVIAIEAELSTEDLARTIHAHPSLAEGMHEAALAVAERAIHV